MAHFLNCIYVNCFYFYLGIYRIGYHQRILNFIWWLLVGFSLCCLCFPFGTAFNRFNSMSCFRLLPSYFVIYFLSLARSLAQLTRFYVPFLWSACHLYGSPKWQKPGSFFRYRIKFSTRLKSSLQPNQRWRLLLFQSFLSNSYIFCNCFTVVIAEALLLLLQQVEIF